MDHKAHQDLLDPPASRTQVNLVRQVPLESQELLAFLVREVQLAPLDTWVPEVPLVHLEPLDLLGFLLLENLDHLDFLGKWDQEESLV